jgi:hypothetical protein
MGRSGEDGDEFCGVVVRKGKREEKEGWKEKVWWGCALAVRLGLMWPDAEDDEDDAGSRGNNTIRNTYLPMSLLPFPGYLY